EEAKMIAADAALQADKCLQDGAAILWPGKIRGEREIEQVGVQIERSIETIGGIAAEARLCADIVRQALARDHHGAEERAALPCTRHVCFPLTVDERAGPVGNAEAEARGVIDLSGKQRGAAGGRGKISRHAVGIAFEIEP